MFGKHRFGRKQYLTDDYPRKKGGATDGDNQHSRSAEGWCAEYTSGTSSTNYFLQKLAYGFNVDKHISAPVGPRQLPSRADLQQTAWVLWLSRQVSWQLIREQGVTFPLKKITSCTSSCRQGGILNRGWMLRSGRGQFQYPLLPYVWVSDPGYIISLSPHVLTHKMEMLGIFFFLMWRCLYFFIFFIYFHWLEANYNIVVVFVIHWHESAMDLHGWFTSRSPLPPPSLPNPSGSSQCTRPKYLSHASFLILVGKVGWDSEGKG